MTRTQPMCVLCWSRGHRTVATVFIDPGWYCDECAPEPIGRIDVGEFHRGLRLGLALGILAVFVGVLVLVVVTAVF